MRMNKGAGSLGPVGAAVPDITLDWMVSQPLSLLDEEERSPRSISSQPFPAFLAAPPICSQRIARQFNLANIYR